MDRNDDAQHAPSPTVIDTTDGLTSLANRASAADRVALDVEANGRFAYRARLSTMQLGFAGQVALVDPLSAGVAGLQPLATLLSREGPVKVVHDVGYDARLLAEVGVTLGNVHDTALTAQWLGRPATGLASLLATELGVTLDKSLQAQDWSLRPLSPRSVKYLTDDVAHLLSLDDLLWGEAARKEILEELVEETTYRLASAVRAVTEPDARPPFARVKGADALSHAELAVLRRLAVARETEAARLDTPAGELVPSAALVAMARAKPSSMEALLRVRRPAARIDAARVGEALLAAVAEGVRDGALSPEDVAWLERRRLPPAVVKARRGREARLSAWRKGEAEARGVDVQVVLPGHCASDLVSTAPESLDALASIDGIGAFRVARYGQGILAALRDPA